MTPLTVAFITSRRDPKFEWFADSLSGRIGKQEVHVIVIDSFADEPGRKELVENSFSRTRATFGITLPFIHALPKPTIWAGKHRITSENWWSKSNSLNSAICLCRTEWIAFVDDRSVLCPGWLDCIEEAMRGQYAVVGTYEKHARMKVENGEIVDPGETLGIDHRPQNVPPVPTHDWHGGHCALPLEWCLRINGFSEDVCDSLGLEDAMFGVMLRNYGFPMVYDSRMKIIEDRTPGEIYGALKRADKGVSPQDKSHKIVEIFRDKTDSQNSFDIRNLRDRVLSGEPFPPPSAIHLDWYDGSEIKDAV